jgi:hypothetical protein
VSKPLDVGVLKELDLGQNDESVEDPVEEERNPWNQHQDQLVNCHALSLGQQHVDFFVLH